MVNEPYPIRNADGKLFCFYKGLNQYEIAEELGIVRPVVSKIMAAAIKRLKKSF